MQALADVDKSLSVDIFTSVPQWFFAESLNFGFNYHEFQSDVGFIQETPFKINFNKTICALNNIYPVKEELIFPLLPELKNKDLIVCDVSPVGIYVANQLGIKSLLIENFTWDWIYQAYLQMCPELKTYSVIINCYNKLTDFHIKTIPFCQNDCADFYANPVARRIKKSASLLRKEIGIDSDFRIGLITSGGIESRFNSFETISKFSNVKFIVPGMTTNEIMVQDNVIMLPHKNQFFHPDLINLSDFIIGKLGYSTVAEAYHSGIPFGFIRRDGFPESPVLENFIEAEKMGIGIGEAEFMTDKLETFIDQLILIPKVQRQTVNGAQQIADFILHKLT